jgi:hypothetical protein
VKEKISEKLTELEKSVKRSELETHRMNGEFVDILHTETSKGTDLISQVLNVTEEDELIRVNNKIIEVNEELENKLERNCAETNSIVEKLTIEMIVKDAETEDKLEKLDS